MLLRGIEKMFKVIQDIVLLIEPPKCAWDISLKCGNMALNRFCIDEETAFESSGVYGLKDRKVIVTACKNFAKHKSKNSKLHFVCVGRVLDHYRRNKLFIHEGMKKNKLQSVMFTQLSMHRSQLITKERTDVYCKGKYNFRKLSVSDDIESLFEDIRLNRAIDNSITHSYFLPKLTEEEMELIQKRDRNYLRTFRGSIANRSTPDVNEDEMKLSESDSKFLDGKCSRRTLIITNSKRAYSY